MLTARIAFANGYLNVLHAGSRGNLMEHDVGSACAHHGDDPFRGCVGGSRLPVTEIRGRLRQVVGVSAPRRRSIGCSGERTTASGSPENAAGVLPENAWVGRLRPAKIRTVLT